MSRRRDSACGWACRWPCRSPRTSPARGWPRDSAFPGWRGSWRCSGSRGRLARFRLHDGRSAAGTRAGAVLRMDSEPGRRVLASRRMPERSTQFHGLSELILRVADVPRAVAFYRDVIGLSVERMDGDTWAWLWTGRPGALPRLGLTSRPLSFGAAHTGGPAHFAF